MENKEVWVVVINNGVDFSNEIKIKAFDNEVKAYDYFRQCAEEDLQDLKESYGEECVHVFNEAGALEKDYDEEYVVFYGTDYYESYRAGEYQATNWTCFVKKVKVE